MWRGSVIARVCAAVIVFAFVPCAFAADALFPQPLHIVRQIDDPVSGTSATFHEYCAGDQVVTVNGAHVAIADYAKQQLIEIDRSAGTYSITRFDELAKANALPLAQRGEPSKWKTNALGVKPARSGRSLEAFELTNEGVEKVTIEIGVDRGTRMSRAALEVLIGASYPNQRREEHAAILNAAGNAREPGKRLAANATNATSDYALPYEQTVTIDSGGERLTIRNSIVEVRNDVVPDEVKLIPPGARLVESRVTRLARELRELDQHQ